MSRLTELQLDVLRRIEHGDQITERFPGEGHRQYVRRHASRLSAVKKLIDGGLATQPNWRYRRFEITDAGRKALLEP